MKIILNQAIDGLGNEGEILDVKAGYARNYLIPKGWAKHPLMAVHDFVQNGIVLLALCLVNLIFIINTADLIIGRNNGHIEAIYGVKFLGLSFSGTGHTSQLLIQSEVVLKCDGGEGLSLPLDGHIFLSFQGLV